MSKWYVTPSPLHCPVRALGITQLRFLGMWPFSHHKGSHIPIPDNGFGWAFLTNVDEWAGKATDRENKNRTESRKAKEEMDRNCLLVAQLTSYRRWDFLVFSVSSPAPADKKLSFLTGTQVFVFRLLK